MDAKKILKRKVPTLVAIAVVLVVSVVLSVAGAAMSAGAAKGQPGTVAAATLADVAQNSGRNPMLHAGHSFGAAGPLPDVNHLPGHMPAA